MGAGDQAFTGHQCLLCVGQKGRGLFKSHTNIVEYKNTFSTVSTYIPLGGSSSGRTPSIHVFMQVAQWSADIRLNITVTTVVYFPQM